MEPATVIERPGHFAVRNFCSPEEYTMYCAVLFYKFVSSKTLASKMGISVRQVELLLQRLKEAGYIRAQTWKDPDGQVAEGKPYEYYYVDQYHQLKVLKYKIRKMRKDAEAGDKASQPQAEASGDENDYSYECRGCGQGRKFTEMDMAMMMGASVCDYCGTELSKIDKAVAVDSKIHLKQQINLQLGELDGATQKADRLGLPPISALISAGRDFDEAMAQGRVQPVGGAALEEVVSGASAAAGTRGKLEIDLNLSGKPAGGGGAAKPVGGTAGGWSSVKKSADSAWVSMVDESATPRPGAEAAVKAEAAASGGGIKREREEEEGGAEDPEANAARRAAVAKVGEAPAAAAAGGGFSFKLQAGKPKVAAPAPPAAADAGGGDDGSDEDGSEEEEEEEEEETVLVGGKPMALSDIGDAEEKLMSPEEYKVYYAAMESDDSDSES